MEKSKQATKIDKRIQKLRSNIPNKYNQIELMEYLTDPNEELFVSISNRSDGKTFGYLGTLFQLACEFEEVRLLILCRHDELRVHYMDVIDAIIETFNLPRDKFLLKPSSVGVKIYYDQKIIALITDLNDATDLKNASALLSQFKIMVYDEFLALAGDYNPGEAYQLATIIGSVNRSPERNKVFPRPKLFLLGNAVNFDSPLLAYYNLINLFETQPLNTLEIYDTKVVELRVNKQIQEQNTTSLVASNDPANTALFEINTSLVVPYKEKRYYNGQVAIKINETEYLLIKYRPDGQYYLEVTINPPESYDYCIRLSDFKKGVKQLTEFDQNRFTHLDYDDHKIKFGNTYSINWVDNNPIIKDFDMKSLIMPFVRQNKTRDSEEIYKEMETKETKEKLIHKFYETGDF